jgi:hypothetical protein
LIALTPVGLGTLLSWPPCPIWQLIHGFGVVSSALIQAFAGLTTPSAP